MKYVYYIVSIFLIIFGGIPYVVDSTFEQQVSCFETYQSFSKINDTEYWALLVGVNEIPNWPQGTLPYNPRVLSNFKDMLLSSSIWKSDHIKVLTGNEATQKNIVKGLKWLDEMDDENDICLFYISTHGSAFPDLPPFDEEDGWDETLTTYSSGVGLFPPGIPLFGALPYIHEINDDQLKFLLNKLDSKGVCAIIETCFSGGFNDYSYNYNNNGKILDNYQNRWTSEFIEEMKSPGKVILMSSAEDEVSQGPCFTYYIINGLQGSGDNNFDGLCSAEESFEYASILTSEWLLKYKDWEQKPQIYDGYPGELQLTEVNFPPSKPEIVEYNLFGIVNNEYSVTLKSFDNENDRIRFYIDWGDGSIETTSLFESNETIQIYHSWVEEGTYNIWIESVDEYGSMNYEFGFPKHITVHINDGKIADQYQLNIYQPEGFYNCEITDKVWQAQSFIPNSSIISKIDLWVLSLSDISSNLKVSIRTNLTGEDIISSELTIPCINISNNIPNGWTTFDFQDLVVTPGETYYIICYHENEEDSSFWLYADPDYVDLDKDPYSNGECYISKNAGKHWITHQDYADDFCFVTY